MKIILGLGNPGKKYENTRHNVGFEVVNLLAEKLSLNLKLDKKFSAKTAQSKINSTKFILTQPQKFMNLSGIVAKSLSSYYDIDAKNLWVITDDINLALGEIRIRHKGSSGNHNGLQSIIDNIKSEDFIRIRLGVASLETRPETAAKMETKISQKNFVLSRFKKAELVIIKKTIQKTITITLESLKKNKIQSHTYH